MTGRGAGRGRGEGAGGGPLVSFYDFFLLLSGMMLCKHHGLSV